MNRVNHPWSARRAARADGRTPFFRDFDFAGLDYLGVSLEMRYIF